MSSYTERQEARVKAAEAAYRKAKINAADAAWEALRLAVLYPKLCDELEDEDDKRKSAGGTSKAGGTPNRSTPGEG